jgi:hypothetical protein
MELYSELVLDSSKLKGLFFYDPIWGEGFIVNPPMVLLKDINYFLD